MQSSTSGRVFRGWFVEVVSVDGEAFTSSAMEVFRSVSLLHIDRVDESCQIAVGRKHQNIGGARPVEPDHEADLAGVRSCGRECDGGGALGVDAQIGVTGCIAG